MERLAVDLGLSYQYANSREDIKIHNINGKYKNQQVEIYCAYAPDPYVYININNDLVFKKKLVGSIKNPMGRGGGMISDINTQEIKQVIEQNLNNQ